MIHIMLFPVLNLLCFYVSAFQSMCAMPNMAVFCSFSILCFPSMFLGYFWNDFEITAAAATTTTTTTTPCYTYTNKLETVHRA
jgi:hypothetical protein